MNRLAQGTADLAREGVVPVRVRHCFKTEGLVRVKIRADMVNGCLGGYDKSMMEV